MIRDMNACGQDRRGSLLGFARAPGCAAGCDRAARDRHRRERRDRRRRERTAFTPAFVSRRGSPSPAEMIRPATGSRSGRFFTAQYFDMVID